jgi:hypothetical protein
MDVGTLLAAKNSEDRRIRLRDVRATVSFTGCGRRPPGSMIAICDIRLTRFPRQSCLYSFQSAGTTFVCFALRERLELSKVHGVQDVVLHPHNRHWRRNAKMAVDAGLNIQSPDSLTCGLCRRAESGAVAAT